MGEGHIAGFVIQAKAVFDAANPGSDTVAIAGGQDDIRECEIDLWLVVTHLTGSSVEHLSRQPEPWIQAPRRIQADLGEVERGVWAVSVEPVGCGFERPLAGEPMQLQLIYKSLIRKWLIRKWLIYKRPCQIVGDTAASREQQDPGCENAA
ncbi:hypothetical protein U5801_09080 [Lamprobacter modestohalophilus]|uniref:hypothetical protein n=1 Tax=Lamprobacter modestohalophilus TaxID=1064514 RepID=UPI002ADEDF83|nr:hypothetical protein [Lamprobacter modestohalophilus]MEA1049961.1 hypothetical protein [Lamprobacter modestohalophilus]